MTNNNFMTIMPKMMALLEPLSSEDRMRLIHAVSALFSDSEPVVEMTIDTNGLSGFGNDNPRALSWLKQNKITNLELQEIFSQTEDGIEFIAAKIPGKDQKEQTHNAYLLCGVIRLLDEGVPFFSDVMARELCKTAAVHNSSNHASYIKDKGNIFTGKKSKGWTLTSPGLNRAGQLIKDFNLAENA